MASIRVCTATLAAALSSPSVPAADNAGGQQLFSMPVLTEPRPLVEEPCCVAPATTCSSNVGGSRCLPEVGISIPQGERLTRRVSFNLDGNSVLQLPSNTAISRITNARTRRNSSLSGSNESVDGQGGLDEFVRQVDRQAMRMLPNGASPDLLNAGCMMTSLCVRRGHICVMDSIRSRLGGAEDDEGGSSSSADGGAVPSLLPMPAKGVLKPFAPSPVNTEFLIHGIPEAVLDDPEESSSQEEGEQQAACGALPWQQGGGAGRSKNKKVGKRKKGRKAAAGVLSRGRSRQRQLKAGGSRGSAGTPTVAMPPGAVSLPRPIPLITIPV